MSTYEQFLATKKLGAAIGATDPAVVIAVKDADGNATTLTVNEDGELLTAGSGGGGGGDATAANQVATMTLIGAVNETAPANDTANSGANGRLQRIAQRLTTLITLIPQALGQGNKAQSMSVALASNDDLVTAFGAKTDAKSIATDTTSVSLISIIKQVSASIQAAATSLAGTLSATVSGTVATTAADGSSGTLGAKADAKNAATDTTPISAMSVWKQISASVQAVATAIAGTLTAALAAGENAIGKVAGYGFDVVATPAVTNGAYSAGDLMGGLMTFTVARVNDEAVVINEIQIAFKSAVSPSLLLVLFEADPTGTTKTDNAVYSLAAADVFKVRAALPVNALDGYLTDHGTPNTIRLPNVNLVMKPAAGGSAIYMLMIDQTGVTLTSTSDVQVRVTGVGA